MSRPHQISLPVPQAVQAGAPVSVEAFRGVNVQVTGTFVATLDIQASLDGTNWSSVVVGVSAPAYEFIPNLIAKAIRVNVTAYTSGQPVATVGGFDENAN